jgi:Lrp/AsnC family transcriptional regulator for asnA, asnC and gidA
LGYPENLVMTDSSNKIDIEYKQKLDLEKKVELDEMDRRVAKILAQNSRVPFTKIAQELNISNKNVIQRYRKLRGSVLTQSTITIDLKKLGYTMMVFLKLEVADKSQINKIANKLLQIPNVITVIELAGGDYDLFPNIVLRDCSELFRLKDQLNEIQGVKKTTVLLFEPHESFPFNMFASLL